MKHKNITYPLYRKYANNSSYFKVVSPEKFEEIQVLGNKKSIHIIEAKILPDRNYINDLTYNYKNHWVICLEKEYEELKESVLIVK